MLSQGLTDKLISSGLLTAAQVDQAQQAARTQDLPVATWLIRQQLVDSGRLAPLISASCHTAVLDLDAIELDSCPRDALDERLIRHFQVLPLQHDDDYLLIAFADPAALRIVEELQTRPEAVEFVVADHIKLASVISEWLSGQERKRAATSAEIEVIAATTGDSAEHFDSSNDGALHLGDSADDNDEAPVVRFVNQIILEAVRSQASDIHFETGEHHYRIRYRIDGVLQDATQLSAQMAPRINARLKVMAGLDMTERRRPQDGRLRIRVRGDNTIDLRLNSMPTLWGEKLVLRILDGAALQRPIEDLGFDTRQTTLYLDALQRAHGLILVTGPTGSGKSVSLYSGLQTLNTGKRNISTVEDPVEIYVEGINQVAVNARIGMNFATALRAFLRQDPDVIMVGEIRDQETADIALTAAQTGHLVLSTLHTNSAIESITRLQDMGVAMYALASALSLVIAQRLVPRLCSHCKQPQSVNAEDCRALGMPEDMIRTARLYIAGSCASCRLGYRGRVAIVEALQVTDDLRQLIRSGSSTAEIEQAARASGMTPLRLAALAHAAQGHISLADATRVAS